jgi:hypothetical protein
MNSVAILAKGFLTSPLIEAPVCSEHHKRLVNDMEMYCPTVEDGCLGANSVSMIKGSSRSCAMHLVRWRKPF